MASLTKPINLTASGDTTVIPATSGLPVVVKALVLAADAVTAVAIKDTNGTSISGAFPLAAYGSLTLPPSEPGWFRVENGNGLVLNQSGTANVQGFVVYTRGQ